MTDTKNPQGLHRELQGGRFDLPDRLFKSIPDTWAISNSSLSEVKELIPELFCVPESLQNRNHFDLGRTQDGHVVNHVHLPRYVTPNLNPNPNPPTTL
jgi:hypothetical protein